MELCSGCPSYWCRMRGGCPKYKGLRRSQLKPVFTGLQRITMVAVFSGVSSLRAGDGGQLPRNNQFLPWQGSLKHNCPLSLSETDFASNTAPCPSASLPPNEGERITALHVEKKKALGRQTRQQRSSPRGKHHSHQIRIANGSTASAAAQITPESRMQMRVCLFVYHDVSTTWQ